MKQKTLYYLAGTFFVLFIIYIISKPSMTTTNIDEIVQSIVIGVDLESVGNVEIYKESGDKKIEMKFAKNGDVWRMPTLFNAKARKSDVELIIKDVLEMQGKVRATGANYFDQFKVNDNQGLHVLLKDETGKNLANLIIGKKGEEHSSGFLRFADKDKIFFADKNILNSIKFYGEPDTLTTFKQSNFADLTAIDYNKDDLETIALVKSGQELIVRKIEKVVEKAATDTIPASTEKVFEWVIERNNKQIDLDQTEVNKFIEDVRKISAQKVVDRIGESLGDMNKNARYGFTNNFTGGIIYIKKGNARVQCLFGKEFEKDKGYYFQSGDDGVIYEVSKTNFDRYFKWIEELPKKVKTL